MNKIFLILCLFSLQSLANYKFTYSVPDIVCGTCEKAIDKYLHSIRSVLSSSYDQKAKVVTIILKNNRPLTKSEMKSLDMKEGYRISNIEKKELTRKISSQ